MRKKLIKCYYFRTEPGNRNKVFLQYEDTGLNGDCTAEGGKLGSTGQIQPICFCKLSIIGK